MARKRDVNEEHLEAEQAASAAEATVVEEEAAPEAEAAAEAVTAELEQRVRELEAERDEWRDRCLRQAAESENFRRRVQRDAQDAQRQAQERLMNELLPVLDNFALALASAQQSDNYEALRAGVEQIYRQLESTLERSGLERIEAAGQQFDPNVHEAIMQVPAQEGQEPNQVVEELRAGYRLNDRVLRPTLVKVTSS